MENSVGLAFFRSMPFARRWVVRFCTSIDPKHLTEVLTLALKDKNPSVRYEAIQTITRGRSWDLIDPVIAAIKDSNARVRMAAVHSLSQFGSPRILDALFNALHDSNPLVREEALRALGKHPKPRYRGEVQRLVLDRIANVRIAALETLLNIHCSEEFVSELLDLALDAKQSSRIRKLAFENMRQAEHLPVPLLGRLEKIAHDENSIALHLEIVKVIAAFPPGDEMQTTLLQFLHHISDDVHRTVIQALGEKGDRKAIFFLSELVREGRKTDQLMDRYDSRLAELAIEKILSRHP